MDTALCSICWHLVAPNQTFPTTRLYVSCPLMYVLGESGPRRGAGLGGFPSVDPSVTHITS